MARHASRSADGVGAVLASRWPFGSIREVDLHVTERVDDQPWAAAVTAEVLLPEPFGLTLFAHHKPTYQVGYARERKLQAVASAVLWKLRWRVAISTSYSSATSTTPQTQLAFGSSPDGSHWTSSPWHTGTRGRRPTRVSQAHVHPSNPLVRDGEWSQELGRRIDYVLVRCGTRGPHCRSLTVTASSTGIERGLGERPLWCARRPPSARLIEGSVIAVSRDRST